LYKGLGLHAQILTKFLQKIQKKLEEIYTENKDLKDKPPATLSQNEINKSTVR
jgi:hypothetical protein